MKRTTSASTSARARLGTLLEEEGAPPRKIDKLADEAFWVPNRFGGTLYATKGDAFITISIGGSDSEQVKLDKAKKLAAKALTRLK
jgi:hypothetical protein